MVNSISYGDSFPLVLQRLLEKSKITCLSRQQSPLNTVHCIQLLRDVMAISDCVKRFVAAGQLSLVLAKRLLDIGHRANIVTASARELKSAPLRKRARSVIGGFYPYVLVANYWCKFD